LLNLITDPWLPVRRLHSGRCTIRPAQLTANISGDPVIAVDWPRPDFRIATLELLVGVLATACPPRDNDSWLEWWDKPPDLAALDAAFAPIAHAFELDGNGPRFLQDPDNLDVKTIPIERLLIDSPGENPTKKNTDLLVKRGRLESLARPAAAIALYTMQAFAPEGGSGNKVGLRGGGPMTTLVLPLAPATLWHALWANVPLGLPPAVDQHRLVFPWLAPPPAAPALVVPEITAHPLQVFWGMPRRIRLEFVQHNEPQRCGLTGSDDDVQVSGWRQTRYNRTYDGWGRRHPLTPYYAQKVGGEFLAVHPKPGGVGYRHWLGLVLQSPDGLRLPAASVSTWRTSRMRDVGRSEARLIAAGYSMDSMKASAFVESDMPLPAARDQAVQTQLDETAIRLVRAADAVARLLGYAVRAALFSPDAKVQPEAELLSSARERLWEQTEAGFFNVLERSAVRPTTDPDPEPAAWLVRLRHTALALFDEAAPLSPLSGSAAPRIGRARRNLLFALTGFGKDGDALFEALGLPVAEPKAKQRKAA
jgi:CRISPR system Cascade subunit CasA